MRNFKPRGTKKKKAVLAELSPAGSQRGGGFMKAGVSQMFGRTMHLQIRTKVQAGIHPRFHKTARYLPFIYYFILSQYFISLYMI